LADKKNTEFIVLKVEGDTVLVIYGETEENAWQIDSHILRSNGTQKKDSLVI